ncbi:MAG: ABC transporter ATP-binding protein [Thermodesulfobacteriota bacterium]|nr:ABC transporter ATP-binding protein [Thermodesulfobacteriota bacterium]
MQQQATPAIDFDHVSKSFRHGIRRQKALRDMSLSIHEGEIFGFLGPNGAGKSTAIKILLNFIRPNKGTVRVEGLVVGEDHFQHRIGYLPETPCFYENLSGSETLWFAGKASGMDGPSIKENAHKVLRRLDLERAGAWPVRTYSKGMKQRLGLAMALIHNPQIYILDEPMSGLDPLGRRLITDVILDLRRQGKTVFFSSHILSDVERLCDRIGILDKGELLFSGAASEIVQDHSSLEDAFVRVIEEHERADGV